MSTDDTTAELQRTPLNEQHRALGAKLVEFGGWEMPVSYRGILEEHRAVRNAAGIFDVSHMGEIEVSGRHAAATCQRLGTNDVRKLADGHVQYTILCREDGGVVDDVTLYRINGERFFFCVNASNIAKDLAWIQEHAGGARVVDRSAATALIAVQGPAAAAVVGRLTPLRVDRVRRFRFARSEVAGVPALVSRTGYTGEDGFELYVDTPRAAALWEALMESGRGDGLEPVGLGARDTLRLEAALALYGHELDDSTSPLAAGLARFVALDGEDFIGRAALLHEREQGAPRRLVGLEMRGPGIARHGYAIVYAGAQVGVVTSGTHSPTLGKAVALAYVASAVATPGSAVEVEIRGRRVPAEIVATPFYRSSPSTVSAPPVIAPEPEPEEFDAEASASADDEAPTASTEHADAWQPAAEAATELPSTAPAPSEAPPERPEVAESTREEGES